MSNKDDLLMYILNCGFLDLPMLEGDYDWCDVLDADDLQQMLDLRAKGEVVLNYILLRRVEFGLDAIDVALEDRINELRSRELEDEEFEELDTLMELSPYDDINGYFNCIDTHVWFEKNDTAYLKYLPEAIQDFELGTGLDITLAVKCP